MFNRDRVSAWDDKNRYRKGRWWLPNTVNNFMVIGHLSQLSRQTNCKDSFLRCKQACSLWAGEDPSTSPRHGPRRKDAEAPSAASFCCSSPRFSHPPRRPHRGFRIAHAILVRSQAKRRIAQTLKLKSVCFAHRHKIPHCLGWCSPKGGCEPRSHNKGERRQVHQPQPERSCLLPRLGGLLSTKYSETHRGLRTPRGETKQGQWLPGRLSHLTLTPSPGKCHQGLSLDQSSTPDCPPSWPASPLVPMPCSSHPEPHGKMRQAAPSHSPLPLCIGLSLPWSAFHLPHPCKSLTYSFPFRSIQDPTEGPPSPRCLP